MRRIVVIDADVLVYQSAYVAQSPVVNGEPDEVVVDRAQMRASIGSAVERIRALVGAQDVLMALTDYSQDYWRRRVYPPYKRTREGRKPKLWAEAREHIEREYDTLVLRGLEGDDVVGILMTDPRRLGDSADVVGASIDKDLRGVPGLLFDPLHERLTRIHRRDADRWHLYQTLTGDRVDNYPGCPKVGPVRAEAALGSRVGKDAWEAVVAEYERRGGTAAAALCQARVARILRSDEYVEGKAEVVLWNPPKE